MSNLVRFPGRGEVGLAKVEADFNEKHRTTCEASEDVAWYAYQRGYLSALEWTNDTVIAAIQRDHVEEEQDKVDEGPGRRLLLLHGSREEEAPAAAEPSGPEAGDEGQG